MGLKCLIVYMDVAPIFASISFPFLERCCNFCIRVILFFFFFPEDGYIADLEL